MQRENSLNAGQYLAKIPVTQFTDNEHFGQNKFAALEYVTEAENLNDHDTMHLNECNSKIKALGADPIPGND